jgi:hypothetical protein
MQLRLKNTRFKQKTKKEEGYAILTILAVEMRL